MSTPEPQLKTTPASAPATGSANCCICNWTNINLLNLGEPGEPRWTCHGCCKRLLDTVLQMRAAIEKIAVVEGEDSGVILLSDEAPMDGMVYRHEHFSPLGDALVALHRMTDLPNAEVSHGGHP